MTWVRWGDTSSTHPIPLKVLEHPDCDDRLLNEVHGFISRCAAQSGAHKTDYVITRGTAVLMAGPSRADALLAVALFAGYLTEVTIDGAPAYKLVDDDSEFLHLRLKAEIEFEQQRRKDNSTPSLVVPVRLRDGDACRWCGRIVDWGSRNSGRSGTYDHLIAGQAATVETYIVACQSCNSSRKDGSRPRGVDRLLPEPDSPYYSVKTIEWLEGNDWRKRNGFPVPPRPRTRYKPGDMAPGIVPAADAPVEQRPDIQSVHAPTEQRSDIQSVHAPTEQRSDIQSVHAPTEQRSDTQSVHAPTEQRSDTQSVHAPTEQRPDTQSVHAPIQVSPAQTGRLQTVRGQSADSADRQGTESASTGRVGSGRDGSGQLSVTPTSGDLTDPTRSRRRRGNRRRRSGIDPSLPQAGDPHG